MRDGNRVRAHLNGAERPDIDTNVTASAAAKLFIGGHAEGQFNFEGRIDEVAVYPRALPTAELQRHYRAAGR